MSAIYSSIDVIELLREIVSAVQVCFDAVRCHLSN